MPYIGNNKHFVDSNPEIESIRTQIWEAGRAGRRLGPFSTISVALANGEKRTPTDLTHYFPLLEYVAQSVDLRQLEGVGKHAIHEVNLLIDQADLREGPLQSIAACIRDANHRYPDPAHISIPKPSYCHLGSAEEVYALFASPPARVQSDQQRTLTIPALEQRIAAKAMGFLIDAYCEGRSLFDRHVVGFRRKRPIPSIVRGLIAKIGEGRHPFLVSTDIEGFFDGIPVEPVIKHVYDALMLGTDEKSEEWKARLNGVLSLTGRGLPQGHPLSPLLSNIYAANTFDRHLRRIGPCIRYADDIAILCENRNVAENAVTELNRAIRPYGLTLNLQKTFITDLVQGFTWDSNGKNLDRPAHILGLDIIRRPDGSYAPSINAYALGELGDRLHRSWHEYLPFHPARLFPDRIARSYQMMSGWLAWAGFAHDSTPPNLQGVLRALLHATCLTPHACWSALKELASDATWHPGTPEQRMVKLVGLTTRQILTRQSIREEEWTEEGVPMPTPSQDDLNRVRQYMGQEIGAITACGAVVLMSRLTGWADIIHMSVARYQERSYQL